MHVIITEEFYQSMASAVKQVICMGSSFLSGIVKHENLVPRELIKVKLLLQKDYKI